MAERTVSLDEEAYERLVARRRDGESFSDVVKRLTGERSWSDVAGIVDDETNKFEAAIEEGRERSRQRRDRLSADEDDPIFTAPAVTVEDPIEEEGIDDVVYDPDD